MSTNGNYGWKPRKIETLTCPSGVKVQVRRPGPEFTLRAGRVTKTFTETVKREEEKAKAEAEGLSPEEFGQSVIAKMSDEELAAVVVFARELVCAMLVSPKLVINPRPDKNEIGPDDIGDDFWWLFNYAMEGFYGIKVPVGDEEVKVSDLESFRSEPSISGDSVDSPHLPSDTEQPVRNQGLDSGTGDRY